MIFSFVKMNPILTVTCTIWLLCAAVNAKKYEGLLFHRQNRIVYDIKNIANAKGTCEPTAIACPALESNPEDKKFIEDYSIAKKPLFVRKTYETTDPKNKVELNICEKPFEMSVLHNMGNLSVEFGYEAYFQEDDRGKYAGCVYENYHSIERAAEVMKSMFLVGVTRLAANVIKEKAKKIYDDKYGKQKVLNNSWKMKLLWLPMFKLRYSFTNMILTTLTYEIRRNSRWPVTQQQCEDNSLGLEAYKGLSQEVDQLYDDQDNIFERFKPVKKPCATGDESCEIKPPCGSSNKCLEKWSLVPLDQFQLFTTSPVHCSHMVTVPIWTDAAKAALKRLDQYLFALFKVLKTPLRIMAGTSGDLTLELKNKLSFSNNIVYLDPKNSKIPTPRIIFKLVTYTLPNCDPTKENAICKYSAVILIHNDPNFVPKHKLCDNIAEEWGWSTLTKTKDGTDYENVYVCPDNETTMKKIFGRFSFKKPKKTPGDLKLTEFPPSGNLPSNIKAHVDETFSKLLTDGDEELQFDDFIQISQGSLTDDEDAYVPSDLENGDRIMDGNETKVEG